MVLVVSNIYNTTNDIFAFVEVPFVRGLSVRIIKALVRPLIADRPIPACSFILQFAFLITVTEPIGTIYKKVGDALEIICTMDITSKQADKMNSSSMSFWNMTHRIDDQYVKVSLN